MRNSNPADQKDKGDSGDQFAKNNLLEVPSITLPKGGGALKSIDEKFEVNAANGTATLTVPLPQAKSRNDFVPGLSLHYNSGSGNSPFGLGWNLSLGSIRRRTDKLLPRYEDATDGDIFQLSGAEDLVPKLVGDDLGNWLPDEISIGGYQIKRYRPRIENGFTLIERVRSVAGGSGAGVVYWKTTTKDNVATFYGLTAASRVADPEDATRVFEWLPEISYDNKGNSYRFTYVPEDLVNVPTVLHEGNRLNGNQQPTNIYLKRVCYGDKQPYDPGGDGFLPLLPDASAYLFNLVLDYGDHDAATPALLPSMPWSCRWDAFSNYKPGFEMRCYRLCRRFLLFHDFKELGAEPVVVRSLDVAFRGLTNYAEADFPVSMTVTGWSGSAGVGYESSSYPPLSFFYQLPVWDRTVQDIPLENIPNIPEGLSPPYQFTDLWNEGIAGILSEQGGGWYYSANRGEGVFAPASEVSPKPSMNGLETGGLQLQSITGDGQKYIVSNQRPHLGYFPLTDGGEWLPFRHYDQYPALDMKDANVKYIDLNGDGMAEIVLSEETVFTWYPALGLTGYDSPELAAKPFDEEKGPAIVFADPVECIFLADMSGDGLTDIVRIRNGEVCYWPNMGYGVFGAKVNMSNAPVFDDQTRFNPRYLHLSDINGTGATDILYLGQDRFRAWLNLSGNAWGEAVEINAFPGTASPNQVTVSDLLGSGTACIVWSSPLPNNADAPLRFIDLMGGNKPYLMNRYTNGMGKQIGLSFRPSTWFYLQDKLSGTPWITTLFFPVHCVAATTITDAVSGSSYACSYTYHHGYYDHAEREFRGFGRVEQTDTDLFDTNAAADQAPVLTKTWYHTGAWFGIERMLDQLAHEYFQNSVVAEHTLPRPVLPSGLSADEAREAARACKGMVLRQEVYALDAAANPALSPFPYSAAEHNNLIRLLQPRSGNAYASFLILESEQISYQYERNPADPRIAHTLNIVFDPFGNVLESYAVAYPRQAVDPAHPGGLTLPGGQPLPDVVWQEQQKTTVIYTKTGYTGALVADGGVYRLPVGCETIGYQAQGLAPLAGFFSIGELVAPAGVVLVRLSQQRSLFLADDLSTPLPLYTMDTLGLGFQQYHLAFDASVTALAGKATDALLGGSGYVELDVAGEWWVPAGFMRYVKNGSALPFLLPYQYVDAFGFATAVDYDGYFLLMKSLTDAVGNVTTIAEMDYRVLAARAVADPNNNVTDLRFDRLGLLVALALRGKGEGDAFDPAFTADLPPAVVAGFFGDPIANGPGVLQGATTRYVYRFGVGAGEPFGAGSMTRRLHANQPVDPRVDKTSALFQYGFEYTDGLGRPAMKKVQADNVLPWIGSGKIVYNNKGKAVMQFEPWFSDTPAYEEAPANGVTPVLYYDPVGRLVRSDFPDGSYAKTEFDAWVEIGYDQNDTVLSSPWYAGAAGSADPLRVDAATKAAAHDQTPMAAHLDGLGRKWYSVAYNRMGAVDAFYATRTVLDPVGNPLQVIDPLGNTVMRYDYDLLKRVVHQVSMDAGERWVLHDAMDKPGFQWDVNGANAFEYRYAYDALHRPLRSFVQIGATEYLFAYTVYGEGVAGDAANNLRTRAYRQFDDAGLLTNYTYDFKGNPARGSRAVALQYKAAQALLPVNVWSGDEATDMGLLEQEYVMQMEYDALNRMVLQVVNGTDTIVQGYGASGMLNTVDVYYGDDAVATPFVGGMVHNEKGQRLSIQYENGTVTKYQYDTETFRLARLTTMRNGGADLLQDQGYYYDPAGNVTYVVDNAQPPVFYNNQKVLSDGNYTYDAVYRLIRAGGREQIGQNTVQEGVAEGDYRDYPFGSLSPLPAPGDSLAMRNYTQVYRYDAAGNMLELQHVAGSGSYSRTFVYDKNQLASTTVGGNPAVTYQYDGHGNLLGLPQLPGMAWNFKDQLEGVVQQAVGSGPGLATYYNYDVAGMRVRKVTEGAGGVRVSERVYLGILEVYREFDGGGTVVLERDTLHIRDGERRMAVIDLKRVDTVGGDGTATGVPYPRYQYGNHLDSVAFELDAAADTISYEEYHPFGTSSFQAADGGLDVPAKRYRYTGKERDEESGLYYHGARYYAPWLCRWVSCDPIGIKDGLNVYAYVKGNPVAGRDPTGKSMEFKQSKITPVTRDEERMTVEMVRHDILLTFGLETTYDEKTHKLTVADTNNDGKIDEGDIEIAKARFMAAVAKDKESKPNDVKDAIKLVDIFLRSLLPDTDKNSRKTSVYLSGKTDGPTGLARLGRNENTSVNLFPTQHFRALLLHPTNGDTRLDELTKDSPEVIADGPLFTILHEMGHNYLHRADNVGPRDKAGDNMHVTQVIQKALDLPVQLSYAGNRLGQGEYSTGDILYGDMMSVDDYKRFWDTGINYPEVRGMVLRGDPMGPKLWDIFHQDLAHFGF